MTSFDDAFERDLAVALAADAPGARPGFKEELRERVDAGFPRERRFSLPSRRKLMPALAVATCAVVAVERGGAGPRATTGRAEPREERRHQRGTGGAAEQAPSTAAPVPASHRPGLRPRP